MPPLFLQLVVVALVVLLPVATAARRHEKKVSADEVRSVHSLLKYPMMNVEARVGFSHH